MRMLHCIALACPILSMTGCTGVLFPAGPIGAAERTILLDALAIMLAIVVPVMVATAAFAWWFRSSNASARYRPNWAYSGRIEVVVWSIPAMVVIFLGGIAWVGSHDLDPAQSIASKVAPLEVQVVSLDWKWLFIYPVQGVASVNELVVPQGTPVHFRLTSATVMNSFFVPQLGSQIYTMAGMVTALNLQADQTGTFQGISAQFSGDGFSNMSFEVKAVSEEEFERWTSSAKSSKSELNRTTYDRLLRQSQAVAPTTFGMVEPMLFDQIVKVSQTSSGRFCLDSSAPDCLALGDKRVR